MRRRPRRSVMVQTTLTLVGLSSLALLGCQGTGPRHFERLRIQGKHFFAKLQDVPELFRDAHLYEVFPNLRTEQDSAQTTPSPAPSLRAITRHANAIADEIPAHSERWNLKEKFWPLHVERLREFARRRPAYVREHFRQKFGGGDDREVKLIVEEGGVVTLNDNITLQEGEFTGRYFANIPITLEAIPAPGFRFVSWSDGATELKRSVNLTKAVTYFLQPNFAPAAAPVSAENYVPKTTPLTVKASMEASEKVKATGKLEAVNEPAKNDTKPGLTRADIILRLSIALVVFVIVALYGSLKRRPE